MKPESPVLLDCDLPEIKIAENQKEYQTIPAVDFGSGVLLSRWKLSPDEIEVISKTGNLYLFMWSFGKPVMPIALQVETPGGDIHVPVDVFDDPFISAPAESTDPDCLTCGRPRSDHHKEDKSFDCPFFSTQADLADNPNNSAEPVRYHENTLKQIQDTCGVCFHDYLKLPDHPTDQAGRPKCPYCMSRGLDKARQQIQESDANRAEFTHSIWQVVFAMLNDHPQSHNGLYYHLPDCNATPDKPIGDADGCICARLPIFQRFIEKGKQQTDVDSFVADPAFNIDETRLTLGDCIVLAPNQPLPTDKDGNPLTLDQLPGYNDEPHNSELGRYIFEHSPNVAPSLRFIFDRLKQNNEKEPKGFWIRTGTIDPAGEAVIKDVEEEPVITFFRDNSDLDFTLVPIVFADKEAAVRVKLEPETLIRYAIQQGQIPSDRSYQVEHIFKKGTPSIWPDELWPYDGYEIASVKLSNII